MRISNWSLAGFAVGLAFIVISMIRYQFMFPWIQPDTDKTLAYMLLGACVIAISWLYNKQKVQAATLEALEEYLADKSNKRK